MKIKSKPSQKEKFGFWNRRFRGNPALNIVGRSMKFKTNLLYSFACEQISKSRHENILDFVKFVKSLPTGFELETTTPMGDSINLPNGLFIPAVKSTIWDD